MIDLASATADKASDLTACQSLRETLTAQREAVSGVSLDEEAIDLMRYQRAFQGASHFLALVDELLAEMLDLI